VGGHEERSLFYHHFWTEKANASSRRSGSASGFGMSSTKMNGTTTWICPLI
jgi:hypothetical protein